MSKYLVTYEVEATDMNDALSVAYLLLAREDDLGESVTDVHVKPLLKPGLSFGERLPIVWNLPAEAAVGDVNVASATPGFTYNEEHTPMGGTIRGWRER